MGYPLFPGLDEYEQMARIMEIRGAPPKNLIQSSKRKKYFFDEFDEPIIKPTSRGKVRYPATRDIRKMLGTSDPIIIDFIEVSLSPYISTYKYSYAWNGIQKRELLHRRHLCMIGYVKIYQMGYTEILKLNQLAGNEWRRGIKVKELNINLKIY